VFKEDDLDGMGGYDGVVLSAVAMHEHLVRNEKDGGDHEAVGRLADAIGNVGGSLYGFCLRYVYTEEVLSMSSFGPDFDKWKSVSTTTPLFNAKDATSKRYIYRNLQLDIGMTW